MDFSLDWFTSIPGLLITAGVLLLLIALIILIATRKKKKDTLAENTDAAATQPAPDASPQAEAVAMPTATPTGAVPEMNSPALSTGTIMDIPAPVDVAPQQPTDPNMANTMAMPTMDTTTPAPAVTPVDPMAQPSVQEMPTAEATPVMPTEVTPVAPEPVAPAAEPAPAMPTVDPMAAPEVAPIAPTVAPEPVAPAVEPTPAMPTVDSMPAPEVAPIAPTVAPEPVAPAVEPASAMPTVDPMETPVADATATVAPEQVTPAVESIAPVADQTAQQGPVIYGGANPIVPEINIQEPQHQIYGGANPLENTQSIPISNLVGPNQQNVVQTPTAEPTIIAQQPAPEQPINPGQ